MRLCRVAVARGHRADLCTVRVCVRQPRWVLVHTMILPHMVSNTHTLVQPFPPNAQCHPLCVHSPHSYTCACDFAMIRRHYVNNTRPESFIVRGNLSQVANTSAAGISCPLTNSRCTIPVLRRPLLSDFMYATCEPISKCVSVPSSVNSPYEGCFFSRRCMMQERSSYRRLHFIAVRPHIHRVLICKIHLYIYANDNRSTDLSILVSVGL